MKKGEIGRSCRTRGSYDEDSLEYTRGWKDNVKNQISISQGCEYEKDCRVLLLRVDIYRR